MSELVELLDTGGYSAVIYNGDYNGGDLRHFTERGVADLHRLSKCEPEFLKGAMVADKVVGKGAAALMASCGVRALYSHVISDGALGLFASSTVDVDYGGRVPHILNRSGDGWCPVESLCRGVDCVEEILTLVDEFVKMINKI